MCTHTHFTPYTHTHTHTHTHCFVTETQDQVMQESPGSGGVDGGYGSTVPAFLNKLWTLVEDPDTNHLICWSTTGSSFHVFDQGSFAKEVLPKYFKHNNMASFVRQLNMYGFRKVVNIEQSGLVKPERDDTEFQHLYFLQGHEHLLEHIKRKVSIMKSEETKVRQEDLAKLLYELQVLRGQQDSMESQMQDIKQQNEMLWREVMSLRLNHTQQQKAMNKLIQFLFSQMQPSAPSGMKRKLPLMLDDGSTTPPVFSRSGHSHTMETSSHHVHTMEPMQHPCCVQSVTTESALCPSSSAVMGEPTISDVTEMSHLSMYGQSSVVCPIREKCLTFIKEEPVSPGVHGQGEVIPLRSCEVCAEPPVLPVAMVQSVLEGRGAGTEERRDRRTMLDRPDICDAMENGDMSLEEVQLLLHSHQQSTEPCAATGDPATLGLPADEWNFTEMDPSLKPVAPMYMFQSQEGEACLTAGCNSEQ
ncbi:heat shock factor protein 4 isoform X2 [Brachyhypopomus gauderio]|uniref:heat shock factor protein 4 isoform X2 n=1 Tax=Brachyhypopomus gauderio TaxID=698409 RepID=UPI004041F928